MNEITTFRWSLEEDIDNYQSAGYDSIGIWLQKVFDYGEENAVDLIDDSSLQVSSVVWAGGFTGSDGRSVADSVYETIHALRISAAMRAGCLIAYAGGRNNHTMRHADRLLRLALDEILPMAELVEVPLALEPMHPSCAADWTFLTSLQETLALVEEFGSPYLKMAYDTYHFPHVERQPALFARLLPHLAVMHLGDRTQPPSIDQNRCLLGAGYVALDETVHAALELDYDGDFDVKLMGQEIEATSYWDVLQHSRSHFMELTAVGQRV